MSFFIRGITPAKTGHVILPISSTMGFPKKSERHTGSPEEIAEAVMFLVAEARLTTGHVCPVNGERSA